MVDSKQLLENYLSDVIKKARSGVREESHYTILENLLEKLGESQGRKLQVDSFPKNTEAGNPALSETIKLQKKIDSLYPKIEVNVVDR